MLHNRPRSKPLILVIILLMIFFSVTLFAQPQNRAGRRAGNRDARANEEQNKAGDGRIYLKLKWKKFPKARKYFVKIMDQDGEIILKKKTPAPNLNYTVKSGKYKIKLGVILSKTKDRVERETKWIRFKVLVNTSLKPPLDLKFSTSTEPGGKTKEAILVWRSPERPDEKTVFYKIYRKKGGKYIDTNKVGHLRIVKGNEKNKIQKYYIHKWVVKEFIKIGETTSERYTVKGLDPQEKLIFGVNSVSFEGAKSDRVDVKAD
ncbi:MAG: hypothetical protein GY754_26140 [bacterium]|nr:hypothetical protein [bacterium]